MVRFKAILASLVLLILVFTSIHSAAGKNDASDSFRSWRRINHGGARGPRKHLVNPTVEHPFEVSELPV
ncbi:hypothetical protein OIU76_004265 [Salix suchowensis]|uniref:Uncharacterized protein n=2 Tax=Salix TaxID=40685 RepID=A0A9Q0T9F1_SALPP|nr:hypothetical protein IMY05_003G0065100 [Salix suchowensis]KAJ6347743.1 hypothetical protein OIU76_004265 [Salix suchowensis]KAJ6388988.1 hypothetical protein OIU77_027359 [Salix suchowensis]KAJ6705902.1 hypothetical protein OIU79_010541 [Salix purpurea]